MYVATTKDQGNAADGRFSTACIVLTLAFLLIGARSGRITLLSLGIKKEK